MHAAEWALKKRERKWEGMEYKICGRALKNERSREAGYGPVCYRKVFGGSLPIKYREHTPPADKAAYCGVPGQMKIYDYLHMIGTA